MIIGAVIVAVMLYKVAAILNENQHFDPSFAQKDISTNIFKDIELGLYKTATNNHIFDNDVLELVNFYKRLYLREGYYIDIYVNESYNYSKPTSITFSSKMLNYHKDLVLYVVDSKDCTLFETEDRCDFIDPVLCSSIQGQGLSCPEPGYFIDNCCKSYKKCC